MVTELIPTEAAEDRKRSRRVLEAAMSRLASSKADKAANEKYGAPHVEGFDFCPAPDLARIAGDLIDECKELEHLHELMEEKRIAFLWRQKGGTSNGKATLGKCTKASGLAGYYAEATFIIWLAADWVNLYEMTRRQVEALLHHELLHAGQEEDENGIVKPRVVGHDAELFLDNIRRYGAWTDDLKFVQHVWQERLPGFDEE